MKSFLAYGVVAFLALILFASMIGELLWRSGLASFSLRKDIVRLWRPLPGIRSGLLDKLLFSPAMVVGGLILLGTGWSQSEAKWMLAGGGLIALFVLILIVRLREV